MSREVDGFFQISQDFFREENPCFLGVLRSPGQPTGKITLVCRWTGTYTDDMENVEQIGFGGRLRTLRLEMRLTQRQVAERCGLPVMTISRLETGRRNPSWRTVRRLADGLGVPVTAFR